MANPNPGKISIVAASVESRAQEERFLKALLAQEGIKELEIIVADCGENAGDPGQFPGVTRAHLHKGAPLPELWAEGIRRANGEWIAILETTCVPAPGWLAAVRAARKEGARIFGGAVELGAETGWVARAAYFCEYGQFMCPLENGAAGELPGNNICFHRDLLETAPQFTSAGFWKTYWCGELKKQGVQLYRAPEMAVVYEKKYGFLYFMARRFHHGRCFGGMRSGQFNAWQRISFALGTFVLPLLFLYRIAGAVLPKGRNTGLFLLSIPGLIAAVAAWSLGEFSGYLCGCGTSCKRIV